MNILMTLSQLEVTGAEVYGTVLSDELINRGNNVYIVSDTLTKRTNATYSKIEFNKRSFKERYKQVQALLKIIKEKDIHVVHAHSRASSWSSSIACKIANIPLITTIHGRQPVHLSRKLNKSLGDYSFAVCENIKNHIVKDLNVNHNKITTLRNMINIDSWNPTNKSSNQSSSNKKIISIIGRLSGPKGDATYKILELLYNRDDITINVVGGKSIPERFNKFKNSVNFLGYVDNTHSIINESSLVIGAGRVAVEALLCETPVLAIGEAKLLGAITPNNVNSGLESNFGDISLENKSDFIWENLTNEIEKSFSLTKEDLNFLREKMIEEFCLKNIVSKIEKTYEKEFVKKKKYEIPILMYHRVIADESEIGVHGTYVTAKQFEEQMAYLKSQNYKTITFKDLLDNNYKKRFNKENKWIMITFDDGYLDNYQNAIPILKKYDFNCIIYILDGIDHNKWDHDHPENPEKKFTLMNTTQLLELKEMGVEFGGHTTSHPKLSKLSIEEAKKEIIDSTKKIEDILGEKLLSFAYPYGDLNNEIKDIVINEKYPFAVATDSGDICFSDDLHQIRRIGIFPKNNLFNFKRKVSGRYNFIKIKREQKRK